MILLLLGLAIAFILSIGSLTYLLHVLLNWRPKRFPMVAATLFLVSSITFGYEQYQFSTRTMFPDTAGYSPMGNLTFEGLFHGAIYVLSGFAVVQTILYVIAYCLKKHASKMQGDC